MGNAFFDLFSRTMIINLPDRPDRRQEIETELRQIGGTIDGQRIRLFPAVRPESAGAFPSIGAHGCFLSHLGVLRAARDAGVETVLLLEDDAHFGRPFRRQQDRVIEALQAQPDWDIFFAGNSPQAPLSPTGPVTPISPDMPLLLAHAVAFRRPVIEAAVPFLETMMARPDGSPEGGPMHVDGAYNWLRRANPDFRTVIATPQLITQRASPSDITPKGGWRNRSPLTTVLRRLKNRLS